MSRKNKKLPCLNPTDLGRSAAEEDRNLSTYYLENEYYKSVLDFDSPVAFFIGRKGIGRSSLLQMLHLTKDPNTIIKFTGDDFALEVISSNQIFQNEIKDVSDPYELLYRTIWEYMILLKILRKVYKGPNRLSDILNIFKKIIGKSVSKPVVDEFLKKAAEIDDTAGVSFGEEVLQLLEYIKPKLSYSLPDGSSASFQVGIERGTIKKKVISQLDLFKNINSIIANIDECLQHNKFYILIDDLDIDWKNELTQNIFIKSLFKAIAKLMRADNLRFIISLREDIFMELQLEDSDKFRDHLKMMQWTQTQLKNILIKRLSKSFNIQEHQVYDTLFEGVIETTHPLSYLAAKSNSPRNIIQFGQACIDVAVADRAKKIKASHILEAERRFSPQKLQDLVTEFKFKYRGLDILFKAFHGGPKEFSLAHLKDEILLSFIVDEAEGTPAQWALGYYENINELIKILLNIGFLGYKKSRTDKAEFIMFQDAPPTIGEKFWFTIHPIYERALDLH